MIDCGCKFSDLFFVSEKAYTDYTDTYLPTESNFNVYIESKVSDLSALRGALAFFLLHPQQQIQINIFYWHFFNIFYWQTKFPLVPGGR